MRFQIEQIVTRDANDYLLMATLGTSVVESKLTREVFENLVGYNLDSIFLLRLLDFCNLQRTVTNDICKFLTTGARPFPWIYTDVSAEDVARVYASLPTSIQAK